MYPKCFFPTQISLNTNQHECSTNCNSCCISAESYHLWQFGGPSRIFWSWPKHSYCVRIGKNSKWYSKNKFELNLKISWTWVMLTIFVSVYIFVFNLSFVRRLDRITGKLAINWQNFAPVGFQLKLAFTNGCKSFSQLF